MFRLQAAVNLVSAFFSQRLVFTLFGAIASLMPLRSQDTIRLRSGVTLLVEVVEISPSEIIYRNWQEAHPVYRKALNEVDYVRYSNGRTEYFGNNVGQEVPPPSFPPLIIDTERWEDTGPFFIGYNLLDVFFPMVTVVFEYSWPQRKTALMIPFSVGLMPWNFPVLSHSFFMGYNPLLRVGLEPRFYMVRFRRMAYVLSPALQYMRANFAFDYEESSNILSPIYAHTNIFRLMVYNGLSLVNARNLMFGFDVGIGYQLATHGRTTVSFPLNRPAFQFRILLGRKF